MRVVLRLGPAVRSVYDCCSFVVRHDAHVPSRRVEVFLDVRVYVQSQRLEALSRITRIPFKDMRYFLYLLGGLVKYLNYFPLPRTESYWHVWFGEAQAPARIEARRRSTLVSVHGACCDPVRIRCSAGNSEMSRVR